MSEVKKCIGCGLPLQVINPEMSGYTNKMESDYCQRCYKMIHYGTHIDYADLPDENKIFELLKSVEGKYIWIIDVTDIESSLHCSFAKFFRKEKCDVIVNKCDIIPSTVTNNKIIAAVKKRLGSFNIAYEKIWLRGKDKFKESFLNYYGDNKLIMCGLSNVGKSTVINELLGEDRLTVNAHPATSLAINELKIGELTIYDTVGLVNMASIHAYLKNKDLKSTVLAKGMRPQVYQIKEGQSFAIGGLARVDIKTSNKATVVFYVSHFLNIHRGNIANGDKYWNGFLAPVLKGHEKEKMVKHGFDHKMYKQDYCISGLGWVTISGNVDSVTIYTDENIGVYQREAMI